MSWISQFRLLVCLALAFTMVISTGCEDDKDTDHKPPAGKGSLVVINNTFDDIHVFIDGTAFPDADDRDDTAYDLDPGVYRVVLDQQGGSRNYRDDIDILEGQLTILDVVKDDSSDGYSVVVYFD